MTSSAVEHPQNLEPVSPQSKAPFLALAEASSAAVCIYQGTRLCYVNQAMSRLTGYSVAELLRMNFYDIVPPANRKQVRAWGLQVQRPAAEPQKQSLIIVTKDGEERQVEWVIAPIEHQGKPAGLGIATDVTALWQAQCFENMARRLLQAALQTPDKKALFAAIHAALQETMPAGDFCVVLRNGASSSWESVYQVGVIGEGAGTAEALRYVAEQVLRTNDAFAATPPDWEAMVNRGEIQQSPPGARYWLAVPVPGEGDSAAGVLITAAPRPYAEGEKRRLEFAASLTAMVLKTWYRSAVNEEAGARVDDLAILYEALRDLTVQRNRARLLNVIAERVMTLVQPSGCAIYLYDAAQDELEVVESTGIWDLRGAREKTGADLVGKVAASRQVRSETGYRPEHLSPRAPLASVAVAIPLLFGGELMGVLLVYDEEAPGARRQYTPREVQRLTFFADVAAVILSTTALFDETRQRLVELEVLYQASLAATQIHSVRAVAQRVAETLEQLMNWQVSVWIIDAERQRPSLIAYGGSHQPPEKLKAREEYINSLVPSLEMGIVGWVCRTGQPVRADNVRADPRYVEGDINTRSELCVPLKVGGRVIGCINVESPQENAFSDHDERLLTTLANQAAIAMENARLFEETRRRAASQAALNEIVLAAARADADLDTFLNHVLKHTLQALGLEMGALWLTPDTRHPYHVALQGVPPALETAMIHLQAAGSADLSRTTVVHDWSAETGPMADLLQSLSIAASLAIPLSLGERCVGGLAVATSSPRRWTEEEINLLEIIGQEIGVAAERMRLFEETQARLQELEAINRVSTALRLGRSLNEMLPRLLEETLGALKAQAGGIWLYDENLSRLRLVLGHGWVALLERVDAQREDGIARTVFANGDLYFSRAVAADPLLTWPAREVVPPDWSALYVPIRTDQETIGVLMASDCLPREFSVSDARLMVTLAEIAGNAIQRMSLYEQAQRHAVELEQRVAERTAELQEALQKAQEADRLKSEFIANINHELRTPLTNLVLYYQMLRAQPQVQTEARLDVIGREIQRLRTLIEDLLNLSRLDSGRVTINPLPHNLNELVRVLVEDRRSLAQERNIELKLEFDPNLPPAPLDAQMVSQAFSNLLTNALNYTPSGGTVRVRTLQQHFDGLAYVGFCVQDNGPGIDAEDMPHIFDRFYRGRAGRESGASGTGLGLSIVKQIVEYHRGKIEVANGLFDGRGASFTVWLPLQR